MELVHKANAMPRDSVVAAMIALMPLQGHFFSNYPELIIAVRRECDRHPNIFSGNSGPVDTICRAVELDWIRQSDNDSPLYVSIQ